MVLPFEDLSPGNDNAWFADGLMSELISSLSNIKTLRLMDQKTSRDFKNVKIKLTDIAREYSIRYFIEGSVRKFGEQIKISLELLDIETGDHLWQYSHKGAFADIFEVQEAVAEKVVEGLKLHLTSDEEKKLKDRGTENAEAYELYHKGSQYMERQTKEGFEYALTLYREAIRLDPSFAEGYVSAAATLAAMYRAYDRNALRLAEAERLIEKAREIKPSLHVVLFVLNSVRLEQGRGEEAESLARQLVKLEPDNYNSHFALGYFYDQTNQPALAIAPYEECLRIKPEYLTAHWNLALNYDRTGDALGKVRTSERALPFFEKRIRLFPDDESARVWHANLLFFAGRPEDAARTLGALTGIKDGASLYDLACLALKLHQPDLAMQYLRNALAVGFASVETFRTDADLDPLREREDFREMLAGLSEP
jgi:adenylate cyclase